MNRVILIATMIGFALPIFSQQDPQMSFNSMNHLAVNPGFAGLNQALCFTAIHRNQWVGFDGRPLTTDFAAHMSLDKLNSGVGINIVQDKIGFNKDFHTNLAYSYHFKLGEGLMGFGMGFGVIQKVFDAQELRSPESLEGGTNVYYDPAIPHSESKTVFDANAGLFYIAQKYYVGLSSTHLTQPQMDYGSGKNPFVRRHYYLTGAYYHQLPNPLYEVRPSIFVKYDAATAQVDLNTIVIFNKQFWGGATYRFGDAATLMVGFITQMNLGFGLAYDITLSSLRHYQSGSVEILLRYCHKLQKNPKRRTVYHSVIIL